MLHKNISIICFLFLCSNLLFAQWTVSVTCEPYPSPFLSDWENNPGIVSIRITTGVVGETVKLVDSLHSQERGFIAKGSSSRIVFSSPPVIMDNRDFINYRELTYNSAYREAIVRTNRLLEGTYTLHTRLVHYRTDALLTSGNPVTFIILAFSPPSLIAPVNDDTVLIPFPTFQWTAATSHPGFLVRYHLKICEMRSGQTPSVAINNIAHHQEVIENQTSFTYPNTARPLEKGKRYVWQVQARDRNNIPIGENEGKSEIFRLSLSYEPPAPTTFLWHCPNKHIYIGPSNDCPYCDSTGVKAYGEWRCPMCQNIQISQIAKCQKCGNILNPEDLFLARTCPNKHEWLGNAICPICNKSGTPLITEFKCDHCASQWIKEKLKDYLKKKPERKEDIVEQMRKDPKAPKWESANPVCQQCKKNIKKSRK